MLDNVAKGGRRETDTGPGEDDLVEVALDVLLAKAVELEGAQIRPVDGFARQRPSPTA